MKENKYTKMKRKLFVLLSVFALLLASALTLATTDIVDSGGTATDLYFTGTSSNPSTWYQDAISPNSDLGLELCGESGTSYIGAAYAFKKGSEWNYTLISYGIDANNALAQTTLRSGDCYITTPMGSLTVSPSKLSSRTPQVFVAAFPGELYLINSTSADGSNPSFIETASSQLLGSYSATRTFEESTQDVTVQTPTITFTTNSGNFNKAASDSTFGVNDDRRMAVAICTDTRGSNCNDGEIINDSSQFPLTLASGVTPI